MQLLARDNRGHVGARLGEVADLDDPLAHPSMLQALDRRVWKFRGTCRWWVATAPTALAFLTFFSAPIDRS